MKSRKNQDLFAISVAIFISIFLFLKFISFFVFLLGALLLLIGYRTNKKNTERNKKRMAPKILMIFGVILAFGGCSGMFGDDEDTAERDQSKTVTANDEDKKVQQFTAVTPQRKKEEKQSVQLLKVIDGDTIRILYKGKKETLNYLLINTPDINKACSQPYANNAYKRNKEFIIGKNLQIKFEQDHKKRDETGALIAYVFADNELVQKALLDKGYATLTAVDNVSYEYLDVLQDAENNAKDQAINIWSENNYVQNNKFKKCKLAKKVQNTSDQKKDDNSTKTQIQGQNNNEATEQKATPSQPTYFSNCTELRAVYPNGVSAAHPAYQAKMDRDKDGTACEAY
ncbi:thermonuclease family protein [Kurthia massiliensis]|uniref:thermonuclease family protein n=1 Tax=Kurthia massiliensis TaxID=1033739 RepID=UPI0002898294|nr:thermonuclease family protein [Kurthia massiliensis]